MILLGAALAELLGTLDELKIRYFIGGSVASGNFGLPRQTNDIDVIAEVTPEAASALCEALSGSFYADSLDAAAAVRNGRSFNVIHLKSAYKFDIFPVADTPFAKTELARATTIQPSVPGLDELRFPVCTPEDTILSKLVWYRRGGETSERQWRDILGVVEVQRPRLDMNYLDGWAARLGVADLLGLAIKRST